MTESTVATSPKSPMYLQASYLPLVLLAGFDESKLSTATPLPFRSIVCLDTMAAVNRLAWFLAQVTLTARLTMVEPLPARATAANLVRERGGPRAHGLLYEPRV